MVTRYFPIEIDPKYPCTGMTLYDLRHSYVDGREDDGCPLTAYFSLPGLDETLLKVHFPAWISSGCWMKSSLNRRKQRNNRSRALSLRLPR